MDVANEILDAIEIIVDKQTKEQMTQIFPGICKSVSGNSCVMSINGRDNTVQFYGSTPTVGTIYRVFVPNGNMSTAFIISGGAGGSGGESDVFYAIYGTTTNAEILAAYEAGKAVYVKDVPNISQVVFPITRVNSISAVFSMFLTNGIQRAVECLNDQWRTYDPAYFAKKPNSVKVTLLASDWDASSKELAVGVPGVSSDETKQLITPTPALASQTAYYNAGIRCTGQSANSLTFTAKTIPTADLTVYVTIQEVVA